MNVAQIEKLVNGSFEKLCDWFVDNKLIIHSEKDKTKSIVFASCLRTGNIHQSNIKYQDIKIKRHLEVTYLGCVLDETMSGQLVALKVIVSALKGKLKFHNMKNRFLSPQL